MPTAPERSPENLLQQFQHLHSVANRLLQLEYSSLEAIKNNDFPTIDAELNQKQVLIEEISHYKVLRGFNQQTVPRDKQHLLSDIKNVIKKIDACLGKIKQIKQETIELVQESHRTMADELQTLVRNQKASKSYQHTKQTIPVRKVDISG